MHKILCPVTRRNQRTGGLCGGTRRCCWLLLHNGCTLLHHLHRRLLLLLLLLLLLNLLLIRRLHLLLLERHLRLKVLLLDLRNDNMLGLLCWSSVLLDGKLVLVGLGRCVVDVLMVDVLRHFWHKANACLRRKTYNGPWGLCL